VSDVFVSYSRRDSEFVHALATDLEARGKTVWIDTQGIGDGEVFPDAIRHAIEASDAFVFVISPESVASQYCEAEVTYAVSLQKRLIPVLRDAVADEVLPEPIRVRNWVPFTPEVDAGAAADRLAAALDTDIEHVKAHTHWLVRALDWDEHDRDRSFLLRGSELTAADGWLSSVADGVDPSPTSLQREYVFASRTAAGRRQRFVVGASLVGVAVAATLAVVALVSRNQAQTEAVQSKSRVWAAESIAQLPVDPERSILIAMAAVRESPTSDAVFALRRALDVSPLRLRLPSVGSQSAVQLYWGPGISYSADGARIAEGSQDGSVRIFDARTGQLVRRMVIGAAAPVVQYSPNGQLLAVADAKDVRIVDPGTGLTREVAKIPGYWDPYPTVANNLSFSPSGSVLYLSDATNVVRWDLRNNRVRFLATGSIRGVGSVYGLYFVAASPDGRTLVVGGLPGVAVIDAHTGRVLATNTSIPTIWWLALSPDGKQIAVTDSPILSSGTAAGTLLMLDAHTLRTVRTLGHLNGDAYTALGFSPDGTRLAFGTAEGSGGVIDLRTGNQLVSFPGHTTNIYQVAFSPDGREVATAAGDGKALIWRAAGNQLRSIATSTLDPSDNAWVALADLAYVGGRLVTRTAPTSGPDVGHQVVQSWTNTGGPEREFRIGAAVGSYVRLSLDGRFVMSGPQSPGGIIPRLTVRSVADHRIVATSKQSIQCCPILSRDGRWIVYQATKPARELEILDPATGVKRRLGASKCFGFQYLTVSQDNRLVAATTYCGQLDVWNAATGTPVGHQLQFTGHINLGPIKFSPDDSLLAVANSDNAGQLTIIAPRTDRRIASVTGDTKGIQGIDFSPDSSLLATASLDGTARIWDARTGQPLRILDDPASLYAIAFSTNGKNVTTLDYAGVINTWDACTDCRDPQALLALGQRRITRQLTPAERRTFLG
jgi:WD40 repeat protein